MRTMMERLHRPERGAAALIIALCAVVLCGAGAISVDYGHAVYDKRMTQHAADAAARAIALDCGQNLATCTSDNAAITKNQLGAANAGSDADIKLADFNTEARTVTVRATRTTDYAFGKVIGKSSGDVSAVATATWGPGTSVPIAGKPILPFAVPLCAVNGNGPGAASSDGPEMFFRTDLLNQLMLIIGQIKSAQVIVANLVPAGTPQLVKNVVNLVVAAVSDSLNTVLSKVLPSTYPDHCGPDGNIVTSQGALWLTGLDGITGTALDPIFPSLAGKCKMREGNIEIMLGQLAGGLLPSECYSLLGSDDSHINAGDTVLIPVYEHGSNPNTSGILGLGLDASLAVNSSGVNVLNTSIRIVGFVPFTVTGWSDGGTNKTANVAAKCSSLHLGASLAPLLDASNTASSGALGIVNDTTSGINKVGGGLLGGLLNGLIGTLNNLLDGLGTAVGNLADPLFGSRKAERDQSKTLLTQLNAVLNGGDGLTDRLKAVTVGCQAVQGHFTRQAKQDPDFDWNAPPAGYPSELLNLFVSVKLIR